jgi:prepilin-type N-terminal cleavage/methylation domain-containing protein
VTRARRPAPPLDQSGLTLVEVLLAIGIIGLALAGLGIVVPVSSQGVLTGNQLSTATFLAEQILERARAATWTAEPPIDCLGVSTGNTAPASSGGTCPASAATTFADEAAGVAGYPQYARTVRITSCALTPCAGLTTDAMRLVEVTVAYPSLGAPSTSPSTVQLASLVSRK